MLKPKLRVPAFLSKLRVGFECQDLLYNSGSLSQSYLESLEAMGEVLINSMYPSTEGNGLRANSECRKHTAQRFLQPLLELETHHLNWCM